ncbi:MAG TPA: phospho-N-acetylmuramoyl-pentapeptide-transferase [Clostridiales bacterium]|nr:phospho-N-acetylmuramoyl-pentapeptide-transferase [Clostridiales bacterium]
MEFIIYSLILSLILTLIFGKIFIPLLRRLRFGQYIRDDGPSSHLKKEGTPTMGGIIFLIPLCITTLLLAKKSLDFVIVAVLVTMGFAFIGFLDDYIKIAMRRSLGLRAYQKIIGQIIVAVIFAIFAYRHAYVGSSIYIPFTTREWDLGIWYIPFIVFVIIGTVNSTNLTDGLDGLASGVTLIVAITFCIISLFLSKNMAEEGLAYISANYHNLAIFAGALAGSCLGFLRYNAYPAKVFMGDTGSLGIGGAIAALAILLRMPLFLPIIGGIYMIESISVILQVASFKLTGRRIFKMSPLHHHFELKGMEEAKIVTMFMIITVVLCLIGLLGV